ncbi:MAG: hypothetical protein JSS27_08060 [Planctomycetes bacterium]|nr:hypothetical protein [Planctomycetota bacterium]
MPNATTQSLAGAIIVAIGLCCAPALAQQALRDGFESAESAWRDGGGDARYRFDVIERVQQGAHTGNGCEHVELSAGGNGHSAYLVYPIGNAPVIAELKPTVWLRGDRPGAQMYLRAVLPRAIDSRTNQPMTLLLPGSGYSTVGQWQQLQVGDPASALKQQTWNLRVQHRMVIDTREAYIDQVVLNLYVGDGKSHMFIDDLEVRGVVTPASEPASGTPATPVTMTGQGTTDAARQTAVELSNGSLLIDGRPFFPRFVEYRGEPLRRLRDLGFNGVVFETQPAAEQLLEARQLGLWLVAPPPMDGGDGPVGRDGVWGAEYDAVAAWHLGSGLTDADLETTRKLAESIRRRDRRMLRPLVGMPITQLMPYSRVLDVVVFARDPLGTSFEQADFRDWIEQRLRLARPGTPCWVTVQTELAPELFEQMTLLSQGRAQPPRVSVEQARAVAFSAIAAGARGVVFRSNNRLDANDAATQYRAALVELMNLELQLLEPWTAGGSQVTTVSGVRYDPPNLSGGPRQLRPMGDPKQMINPTLTISPDVQGLMLQTERARLLLPVWQGKGAQYVAGQSAANNLSFILPGVPESTEAYELTPGGLRPPFKRQRVTGGVRVTFDEAGMSSMAVLTQDPLVVRSLSQRLAETGRRTTELQRWLAGEALTQATEIDIQLTAAGRPVPEATPYFSAARANMQLSDQRLAENDLAGTVLAARRAQRPVRLVERAHWQAATRLLPSPASSPLAASISTLPEHLVFSSTLATIRWQPNRLPEGDFEDIGRMVNAGWQRLQYPIDGVKAEVDLSTTFRHGGVGCLHLSATPSAERGTALLEVPPVWMTSPAVQVEQGSWLRISGWVYVPGAIGGSYDGVMIYDSQTGPALAERIDQTARWQQFVLLRAARYSGPLTITIALTGTGEAWIDDVMIETAPGPASGPSLSTAPKWSPR